MSYSAIVKETINKFSELEIIDAQKVYTSKCTTVSEQTYYKAISRMTKNGEIERLAKGIYCKPRIGRFGRMVSSEKHILAHYLGLNNKHGVVVGYRMYNTYNLTTQISKGISVYSNVIEQEKKNVLNVEIKKANLRFDSPTIHLIELLDVLENIHNIEDLNGKNAILFIEKAVAIYNDNILEKLIRTIGYKKSTLASLKDILDYYKVSHSVGKYLSVLSNYKTIKMEDLYDITQ